MSTPDEKYLNELRVRYSVISAWYNLALTSILIAVEIALYIKIKGRMDIPSKVVIGIYTLAFLFESFIWIRYLANYNRQDDSDREQIDVTFAVMNQISIQFIWLILYIFVYETKTSEAILRSKDLKELHKRQSRVRRNRTIVLSIVTPILVVLIGIVVRWNIPA